MNHYYGSDGTRYSSGQIERYVRNAKKLKLELFRDEHGYYFCEDCKRGDSGYLDCSHDISVQDCKTKSSVPLELAWDYANIKLRCRECHQKKDGLNLQFS